LAELAEAYLVIVARDYSSEVGYDVLQFIFSIGESRSLRWVLVCIISGVLWKLVGRVLVVLDWFCAAVVYQLTAAGPVSFLFLH